jgi:hypothetical protein
VGAVDSDQVAPPSGERRTWPLLPIAERVALSMAARSTSVAVEGVRHRGPASPGVEGDEDPRGRADGEEVSRPEDEEVLEVRGEGGVLHYQVPRGAAVGRLEDRSAIADGIPVRGILERDPTDGVGLRARVKPGELVLGGVPGRGSGEQSDDPGQHHCHALGHGVNSLVPVALSKVGTA